MELFMLGLVSVILVLILLGWIMIGAAPLVVPFVGVVYLIFESYYSSESEAESAIEIRKLEIKSTECILVVDDQYSSVIPLIKILEQAKIPFKYVANGIEAIKELSQHHFRLIVIDQFMPKLSGSETLTAADELLEGDKNIPVIFYSGTDMTTQLDCSFKHLSIVDAWNKSLSRRELSKKFSDMNMALTV